MPFDEEEIDPHGECAAEIKRLKDGVAILTYQSAQNGADAMNIRNLARRLLDGETLSLQSNAANGESADDSSLAARAERETNGQ